MKHIAMFLLVAIACQAAGAAATEQGPPSRVQAIRADLEAGKFQEAAAAARAFIGGARDEQAKTEAMQVLATALRKQGEWRSAAKAYADLKDRYEKGSASYVLNEATAEVLHASPKGFYPPQATSFAGEVAAPRTLADDKVLEEALVRVGEMRAEKLKVAAADLKKAPGAREIAAKFVEIASGLQGARYLKTDLPVTQDHEAAEAAGAALDRFGKECVVKLQPRLTELEQAVVARHTMTSPQRTQLAEYQEVLTQATAAEETFRETAGKLPREGWGGEFMKLAFASGKRSAEYRKLTTTCRLLPVAAAWR